MPDNSDFYIVIHVWTTCDEHGVCVSKDSAEVIEIAWILIDKKMLEEVRFSQTRGVNELLLFLELPLTDPHRCVAKKS